MSRGRDRSLILEDEDAVGHGDDGELRTLRKRSMPPSRPRNEQRDDSAEFRRQRSHRDFKQGRRDSKGDGGEDSVGDDVTAKKGQGTIVA